MTKQEEFNQKILEDISILKERLEMQRTATEPLSDMAVKIAVLENQVTELLKSRETWGTRGWSLLLILMAALFSFASGIAGVLLSSYLQTKR